MAIKNLINKKDIKYTNSLRDYSGFPVPDEHERLILSKHIAIDINSQNNLNTLVIGPSGHGKFHNFIKPNMFDNPKDTCFVIMDTGDKLFNSTHETMKEMGYHIEYFNPYNKSGHSVKYDPLNYCFNSARDTIQFANVLYEKIKNNKDNKELSQDPFWNMACKNLLSLIALYMRSLDDRNFSNMLKHLQDFYSNLGLLNETYNFFSKRDDEDARLFVNLYNNAGILSKKTLQTAIFTLIIDLAFMEAEVFKDITNPLSDCKVYTMFDRPTVFYIEFQLSQEITYNFLSEMLLAECIKEIQKRNAQKLHVRFLLDDFPILGDFTKVYPDFIKTLALSSSYKMSFYLIVQSLSQIQGNYDSWQEIVNHMSNKVIFGCVSRAEPALDAFVGMNWIDSFDSDEVLVIVQDERCPRIDKKYSFCEHNKPCIACTDLNCKEPTKRINGLVSVRSPIHLKDGKIIIDIPKSKYTYTCKYIENGEECPYSKK